MEKPVTFRNRNGRTLFGMLHLPNAAVNRRIGVLISVNAIKYRLGTFRLHVLLARRLCALGYTVFSFDPEGIGDSEGEFEYKLLSEHYYDIQVGKYTNDLRDAVEYFRGECHLDSLVTLGLCGGAISILLEAADDPRIDGLILLNLPVLVEDLARKGAPDSTVAITSTDTAAPLLKAKFHRLIEPKFWWRVVTLKVDFREESQLVSKAMRVILSSAFARKRDVSSQAPDLLAEPASKNRLYNMHFQRAFGRVMAARKPALFVFAEHDQWTWIFKSEFQDSILKPGNPFERYCDLHVVKGSNHIFSARASHGELAAIIVDWLDARWTRAARAASVI